MAIDRRRPRWAPATLLVLACSACGGAPATRSDVVLHGAINGAFRHGYPSSCSDRRTIVTGLYGPNPATDYADLAVTSTDAVTFDAGKERGVFRGSGVTFRPSQGWDIDAQLTNRIQQKVHITGHLSC